MNQQAIVIRERFTVSLRKQKRKEILKRRRSNELKQPDESNYQPCFNLIKSILPQDMWEAEWQKIYQMAMSKVLVGVHGGNEIQQEKFLEVAQAMMELTNCHLKHDNSTFAIELLKTQFLEFTLELCMQFPQNTKLQIAAATLIGSITRFSEDVVGIVCTTRCLEYLAQILTQSNNLKLSRLALISITNILCEQETVTSKDVISRLNLSQNLDLIFKRDFVPNDVVLFALNLCQSNNQFIEECIRGVSQISSKASTPIIADFISVILNQSENWTQLVELLFDLETIVTQLLTSDDEHNMLVGVKLTGTIFLFIHEGLQGITSLLYFNIIKPNIQESKRNKKLLVKAAWAMSNICTSQLHANEILESKFFTAIFDLSGLGYKLQRECIYWLHSLIVTADFQTLMSNIKCYQKEIIQTLIQGFVHNELILNILQALEKLFQQQYFLEEFLQQQGENLIEKFMSLQNEEISIRARDFYSKWINQIYYI